MISPEFVNASAFLGELISLKKSQLGTCAIRQQEHLRWLLINNTLQSICHVEHPEYFLLPHLAQLEVVWKAITPPTHVLEIGLGGGTIRNYLNYHHPQCTVTSVERNQDIIDLYLQYFTTSNSHNLITADITDLALESKFDWIIIDLFSQQECPMFLFQERFYERLSAFFSRHTERHLFINFICETVQQTEHLKHILSSVFGCQVDIHSVQNYSNKIVHLHF